MRRSSMTWTRWGLVVLCLVLVGLASFWGGSILSLAAFLLLAVVVALATGAFRLGAGQTSRARVQTLIALLFGLVGSVLGVWSALSAVLLVGSDPLYHNRLWAGWLALLLALLAFLATPWLRARPIPASLLILLAGLGGFVFINLFFINTFYLLAIPFWILAVAVRLIQPSS